MARTMWLMLLGAITTAAPLPAIAEDPCGIEGARTLLDFDVMHPPSDVLHLGSRLDVKVIGNGDIGLDVRDRSTGKPIFAEAPHGLSFYEVSPSQARLQQDNEKVRVLETWIYAVILYIDYRDVRVALGDRSEDEFVGGRVRVCIKGKPN
jgi:hypothetical protein